MPAKKQNIDKKSVNKRNGSKHELQLSLLKVQQLLKASNSSAIVIVSGMEGAGKGEVVNQLNEWFDVRAIQTVAFWEETDDQKHRPIFWRFWRALPARGTISIMFGSWYSYPVLNRLFDRIDEQKFQERLHTINEFERMLIQDGTIIVKLWYQLSKEMVKQRVQEDAPIFELKMQKFPQLEKLLKLYDGFEDIAEKALLATNTESSPWHFIDATDSEYRDLTTVKILENSFMDALSKKDTSAYQEVKKFEPKTITGTFLNQTDLSQSLSPKEYTNQLEKFQEKLTSLAWQSHYRKKSVVIVFEGWDAAGKGGVIRRMTRAIDARLYKAISIGAPTDEENAHHYLWRFWRHVPLAGYMTLYDRSWYGRVLVERVEGFAQPDEWKRSYSEIRHFEEQLTSAGIIVLKFWLHISKAEQLRRFREREKTPWKSHKITDEDWRNREKWDQYEQAVNEMISQTSTDNAPWNIIPAEDKKFARIEVIKKLCDSISTDLN